MKLIDVKNVQVYGLAESVRASKFPFSTEPEKVTGVVTETTGKLAGCPIGAGDDNFLNGIVVQFDLTCSLKMWTQLQRYHFIDFVSSQSTMHRITKFDIPAQCNEYVDRRMIEILKEKVEAAAVAPTPETKKEAFLHVIYNIPSGFKLTARMTTDYRQLKTIYRQRKHHRLPEWREFCEWIETLPFHEWITGVEE